MDEQSVAEYIKTNSDGVETSEAYGYTFFFVGSERMMPFATLIAADNEYDSVSNLDRPGVFRLNVGVSKATYRSLFGPTPPPPGPSGVVETGHDFTALDTIMPHPVYAPQSWICVLSPSGEIFDKVRALLAGAYEIAAKRSSQKGHALAANV